jgi:chemotaxis family two-component system response regulator Rcp1
MAYANRSAGSSLRRIAARPPRADACQTLANRLREQPGSPMVGDPVDSPNSIPVFRARPVEVLLIEDSPADVALTKELLNGSRVPNRVTVAGDGEQAMAILRRKGRHAAAAVPDMIMLDLNLPRVDGRDVLAELKSDPMLRRIPVVVLSTSSAEHDIRQAYDQHVNAYVTKPIDLDQFIAVIAAIEAFWLTVARLPTAV